MKIYWTKYALTTGIQILIVQPSDYDKNTYIDPKNPYVYFIDRNNKDWFNTKKEALNHAEIMREKKLISIEKQRIKIKNIDFQKQLS